MYYLIYFSGEGKIFALTKYEYEAFGTGYGKNENDTNPLHYCEECYDSETGLIYLRNRYYDSTLGRFISEDPYWTPQNMIYGDDLNNKGKVQICMHIV